MPDGLQKTLQVYLLDTIANALVGTSTDPQALITAASSFQRTRGLEDQVLLYLLCQWANKQTAISPTPPSGHTFTTNFPNVETPLSQGGLWLNGATDGLDWSDCAVVFNAGVHYAAGLQNGITQPAFSDATAILKGTWLPNQSVSAVFHSPGGLSAFKEAELRLRSSLSAHSNKGYEIDFSVSGASPYIAVIRWNGALGDFTDITPPPQDLVDFLHDGDVAFASIIGNNIIVKLNGVTIYNFTDNSYASGNPGIGFSVPNTSGVDTSYGWSSFTATDGL